MKTAKRKPGNPKLSAQRNTDTSNANKTRQEQSDDYSRQLLGEALIFVRQSHGKRHIKLSDFTHWLSTERGIKSPRGGVLRQEGVKRALARIREMDNKIPDSIIVPNNLGAFNTQVEEVLSTLHI